MSDEERPAEALRTARVVNMPAPSFSPSMIEQLNARFALARVGAQALVMDEGGPDGEIVFMPFGEWKRLYAARPVYVGERKRPLGDLWVESHLRRSYEGVVFRPGESDADERYYNLWRGWAVEPSEEGDASPWFEHVHEIICGGDGDLSAWVTAWFAHMIQRPMERPGTALVLRGGQGTGKTMLGEIFGRLLGAHYLLVDNPRYIIGQFNSHLATCLLLQADEGFWAGDKQAEGHLKGLVTSSWQMLERKGVDPVRMRNFLRLLVTSNEDWVVPVGFHERRFCVIDVAPSRRQDHAYFGRLARHFEDRRNAAALLRELMDFHLDAVDLRRIPRTEAMLDQLMDTVDPLTVWWFEALDRGGFSHGAEWPKFMSTKRLYQLYHESWDRRRIGRPVNERAFGKQLRRLCPQARRERRMIEAGEAVMERLWGYAMPPLQEAREAFERVCGMAIRWADDDPVEL